MRVTGPELARSVALGSRIGHKLRQKVRLALAVGWDIWVARPYWTLRGRAALWTWGAQVGDKFTASGPVRLYLSGRLAIGANVIIHSGPSNFVGADHRTAFRVGRGAEIVVEDRCGISNSTLCAAERILLRDGTFIGGGCEIYDNDFHPLDPDARLANGKARSAPIEIGPRAFVGAHTIILKGVTIGEGAVIGAGSLVTRAVPAFEIWGGRPARPLGRVAKAAQSNAHERQSGGACQ